MMRLWRLWLVQKEEKKEEAKPEAAKEGAAAEQAAKSEVQVEEMETDAGDGGRPAEGAAADDSMEH